MPPSRNCRGWHPPPDRFEQAGKLTVMAAKLNEFYKQAAQEFGLAGRIKLAMLTKISSEKAENVEDSPENIRVFEQALEKLRRG
jgi:hypothetical protein